jgi:hypothetical protein
MLYLEYDNNGRLSRIIGKATVKDIREKGLIEATIGDDENERT